MKFKVGDEVIINKKMPVIVGIEDVSTNLINPPFCAKIVDSDVLGVGKIIHVWTNTYLVEFKNELVDCLDDKDLDLASKLAKVLA